MCAAHTRCVCVVGGAVGQHIVKDLGKQCAGRLSKQGRDNLARLDKGLLPGSGAEAKEYNLRYKQGKHYVTGVTGRLGGARPVSACGAKLVLDEAGSSNATDEGRPGKCNE